MGCHWEGKAKMLEEKPNPVPLCPQKISQGPARNRTRAFPKTGQWLVNLSHATAPDTGKQLPVFRNKLIMPSWRISYTLQNFCNCYQTPRPHVTDDDKLYCHLLENLRTSVPSFFICLEPLLVAPISEHLLLRDKRVLKVKGRHVW